MPGISPLLDLWHSQSGGEPMLFFFFWSVSPFTPCGTSVACATYLEPVSPTVSTGKQKTFRFPDMLFTQFPIIICFGDIVEGPFILEVLKDLLYSPSFQAKQCRQTAFLC